MTEPSPHQFVKASPDRRGSRRLVLTAAVAVALISTRSAYLAMVHFGVDVVGMSAEDAWTSAGVFELSLATVALLAREAAKENRPSGTLLSLTWVLSSASGFFAAWHELYIGNPVGAAMFRFTVPLLAALMWHLALIGDRHLATGTSWSEARTTARMHALFTTTETWFRARAVDSGGRASRRAVARADRARQRARRAVLKHVGTGQIRSTVAVWLDAVDALGQGTDRVGAAVCGEVTGTARVLTSLAANDDGPPPAQPEPRRPRRRRTPAAAADRADSRRPAYEIEAQPNQTADGPAALVTTSPRTESQSSAHDLPSDDTAAVAAIRELDAHFQQTEGRNAPKSVVCERLGCGSSRALRLMALAREGDAGRLGERLEVVEQVA